MRHTIVGRHGWWRLGAVAVVLTVVAFGHPEAQAQQKKPNRFCRKVRFLGQNPKNGTGSVSWECFCLLKSFFMPLGDGKLHAQIAASLTRPKPQPELRGW